MELKKTQGLSLIALSMSAHSGFYAFTMHSRANCVGFNESVSWHFNHPNYLITWSQHSHADVPFQCNLNSDGWRKTWRAAAYHYAEGYGGWYVLGNHWTMNDRGDPVKLAVTDAVDCNIYDGWWDA